MEIIHKISELLRKNYNNLFGIRTNVILLIMLFVTSIVIVFEFFSFYILRNYYEATVSGYLLNQAKYDQELFINYLSDYSLEQIVVQDKDQFYRDNDAQVQILDNKGIVLFDSLASSSVGSILKTSDVIETLNGGYSSYTGKVLENNEPIMSLSYALNNGNKQIGIIRLTTSLNRLNNTISSQMTKYYIFGIIIILFAIILSFISSNQLVLPLKELIKVSEKFAKGDYTVKANVDRNDEVGELAKTLNFMGENIIKKEDLKNDFISSVSHELRTPMTSIKGRAITLQSKPIQEDKEMLSQGLKIIENESDRLSNMVEDLLDFSRLQSSSMTYIKKNLNIVELAQFVYNQLLPRANNKGLNFKFESAYKEIIVFADESRMKEVFINIIDNAIKFTSEGEIVLRIEQDKDNAVVSISDTGEGIKEDEIKLITQKFFKGSSSHSQTGLGLSICEEIINAHEGSLMIESKYTKGTKVFFSLPKVVEYEEN